MSSTSGASNSGASTPQVAEPTAATDIALTLLAHGVDVVYCLPGEETIELLGAIESVGIELIVTRHEQHAAFMAAAHSRFTGTPGVVITTLGPGMTNTITGMAQASLCGFGMLVLCGQKPAQHNEEGSFQVLDLPALAGPVSKWTRTISDSMTASADTARGLLVAASPRPGPVLIELPEDVAAEPGLLHRMPAVGRLPPAHVSPTALAAAAERLGRAERPVVLVGAGGQLDPCPDALLHFTEATGIGVVATQMGKGSLREDHDQSLFSLSLNTPDAATAALTDADLILAVGFQPVEHPPSSINADEATEIIHLSASPPEVERYYQVACSLVGDPAAALLALADLVGQDTNRVRRRRERTAAVRSAIEAELDLDDRAPTFAPSAHTIVGRLRSILDPNDIVSLDNGVYKLWFARHYLALGPNTLVLDNALATMGAGLATAMVAAMVHPDRQVVAVCGDGGFMMNLQDLETARRHDLGNLTVLVLNDDTYGFIAWHQQEEGKQRTGVDVGNPDFVDLARSFGVQGARVTDLESLDRVLAEAVRSDNLTLIECPLDQSRNEELGKGEHRRTMDRLSALLPATTSEQ